MSADVLEFASTERVERAWQRYIDLVSERADRNLWADLEHNKRIARAWDDWSRAFLAQERRS